ncbi:ribonuclease H-like domain-containing protein [Halalkalibacterium halodurans]|uniref:ribonuclease H-like domain-containing protein n=1 Tax=Halalkalibacterium halodurans TaxID=86665 RepID=UPI002E20AF17|nr:ribonuclease H-like domain-containing protein [Halalkalibacterium halodurans]
MALKGKLSHLKAHMGVETGSQSEQTVSHSIADQKVPYEQSWRQLHAKPAWFEDEYSIIREVSYDLDKNHGRYPLRQVVHQVEKWQEHIANHPLSAKGMHVEELLFFDTETTGLSHGAGTTIFMLGYAQVKGEEVVVKQHFLPGPEREVALYHHFLHDVGDMKNLVTFNGKAFDWPQVKTRHTFVRDRVPYLPKFGHYDLLHASRRLWKELLPSCKLSVVEQEILHFHREEDTPGYLAPMLYFDFLQDPDPELVKGVFQHNEWDVLSLLTLYAHLSASILEVNSGQLLAKEQFEVARWYEAVGELGISQSLYEQLAQGDHSIQAEAMLRLAHLEKKRGRFERAQGLYETLIERDLFLKEAGIELAKIYEHQLKDVEKAFNVTKKVFMSRKEVARLTNKHEEAFLAATENRLRRLEDKVRKSQTLFPGQAQD